MESIGQHVRIWRTPTLDDGSSADDTDDDGTSYGSIQAEREEEDQGLGFTLAEHLALHRDNLDTLLQTPTFQSETIASDSSSPQRHLIRYPVASKIRSTVLHPALYRLVEAINDIEAFANLIGRIPDSRLPSDWRSIVDSAVTNRCVLRKLYRFAHLPDGAIESIVEREFVSLVSALTGALDVEIVDNDRIAFGIGGLLARDNYAYRGCTDLSYKDSTGQRHLLITEFKTTISFPTDHTYYHGSRGAQIFGALYSVRERTPVFLLTQAQFKIFLESEAQSSILTFPPAYDVADTFSEDFCRFLAVCLLSGYDGPSSPPLRPKCGSSIFPIDRSKRDLPSALKPGPRRPKRSRPTGTSSSEPRRYSRFQVSDHGEPPLFRAVWALSQEELRAYELQWGEIEANSNGDC